MNGDFQQVYERVRSQYEDETWDALSATQRVVAIYETFRQLDRERLMGQSTHRTAGKMPKRQPSSRGQTDSIPTE